MSKGDNLKTEQNTTIQNGPSGPFKQATWFISKSKEIAAHHKLKKNKNNLQMSGMLDSHLVQVSMVKTTHGCSSYLMIYGATKQSVGIEKTVV